jgi:hypothetical protein
LINRPEQLPLSSHRVFIKRKGQKPLWLKAFLHFFNTLSDRLALSDPAFSD